MTRTLNRLRQLLCAATMCGPMATLALFGNAAIAAPGDTELVSRARDGGTVDGGAFAPAVSADGRYVAFEAWRTGPFVPGVDGNNDILLRDRAAGVTERITVGLAGARQNDRSAGPAIDWTGRYVAYTSHASNLVPADTNGETDVFLYDRETALTQRISVGPAGRQANGPSQGAEISGDGRYVAFTSSASNLVRGDTNGVSDAFIHDVATGVTERVSLTTAGLQVYRHSFVEAINADGRYVVFGSGAARLSDDDTNLRTDIYVRDRRTARTERISVDSDEIGANFDSSGASISSDGRYVAFGSRAWNLVPGDTPQNGDVFVRDRLAGVTELVSVPLKWGIGSHGGGPSISADGRYVTFVASASNLVPGDDNQFGDAFVRDRQAGITTLVSVDSNGTLANGTTERAAISADGHFVAFESRASNLAANDTNDSWDVFIHQRGGAEPGSMLFEITPRAAAFGDQALFTTRTLTFWLESTGLAPLAGVTAELRGPDKAQFAFSNDCGGSVAAGSRCRIDVTFRPTSVGVKSAGLRVTAQNSVIRTRDLSGRGVRPAE